MPTDIIPISYIRIGEVDHPIDAVTVGGKTLADLPAALPALSNEDEEKIMMVLQGQWTMTSASMDLYNIINGLPCPGGDSGDSESEIPDEHDYPNEYLTFEVLTPGNIAWKSNGEVAQTIQYSKNNGTWTSITAASTPVTIPVVTGDVVRFKGSNNYYGLSKDNFSGFGDTTYATATYNISGNIMSLLYGDNFQGQTTISRQYVFFSLFDGSGAVSAENLILPSMTLTPHCYRALFANCLNLTTAPQLPATTLAASCYRFMFDNDAALTTPPDLPAKTLQMESYYGLFHMCSGLHYIKCMATDISASGCTRQWVEGLPRTGVFVKDVNMYDFAVNDVAGIPIGWTVTEEGTLIVEEPLIECSENRITITAVTPDSVVYYKLNHTGEYQVYLGPIDISEDTFIEFYATKNGTDSSIVTRTYIYVEPEGSESEIGDSDSESEETIHDYSKDYLTFDVITPGTILWKATNSSYAKTISYSKNDGAWIDITSTKSGASISVTTGDKVRFKGSNSTYSTYGTSSYYNTFGGTSTFDAYGNIMSLIGGDNFSNLTTLSDSYTFGFLFRNCVGLISAENLILPATTLTNRCYISMFSGCTGLISVPVLPATTLVDYCYYSMFSGCTGLISAPALPATTLASYCYYNMFQGCTGLTTAPELPATTLTDSCYSYMFSGCTGLTTAPELPATTLASKCYECMFNDCTGLITAPTLPVTTLANGCYASMFSGCTSLTTPSTLPATTLASSCYSHMFSGCTSLTTAPTLSVTTLVSYCYASMFSGCTKLTSAPVLPATTLAIACYSHMFSGCTSLTTPPVLPATTLATYCYYNMFSGCSSLNYIKCLATDISAANCTTNWVNGVANSGTFVKADDMIGWTIDSVNGIPVGWTLINVSDESISEDSDYGDSDSDYGDSESEEPVITVSDPVISIANNTLTITCDTTGATIYYKLGESGTYQEYTTPVALGADTTVYAYASLNGVDSEIVSEGFVHNYSLDYLTFTVLTGGNILWKSIGSGQEKTISYSINDGAWTSITATSAGTEIPVSVGDTVRFKGTNSTYAKDKSNYSGFDGGTATYDVEGNMMSLIYGDNFVGNNTLSGTYNFCSIFKQSKAVSAENMILPATTLTNYCYRAMFSLAPNLVVAPALPATTLAQGCYWYMFEKCPMSTAPDLPAQTLVQECYGNMFINCSNLNYIKCLATTKSATNCLQNWVKNVAATGTFVKDVNTSWSTGVSGIPTGWVVFDGEVVDSPVISFNGEDRITITCETTGATIYYRLGTSGSYTEYTGPITISADTTVYAYAEKDGGQSQTVNQECVYSEHIYKFGYLKVATGPLYYGSNGYEIKDSWNFSSYGSVYGKSNGSTFFSYIEMGDLFKKSGFTASDGSILNTLDPLDGWRLPTKDEWDYMTGTTRTGSSVNGASGKHYAFINFDHDSDGNTANIYGVLLFPDGETITGASLSNLDNTTTNTNLTAAQVNDYLSQGCIFLPAEGYCQSGSFDGNNTYIGYWSSIEGLTNSDAYIVTKSSTLGTDTYSKTSYLPVYLVRDTTYGEETPLEGATKSLDTWTI